FLLILSLVVVGGICVPLYRWTQTSVDQLDSSGKWTPQRLGRLLLGPEQIAGYVFFSWACLVVPRREMAVRRPRTASALDPRPGPVRRGARLPAAAPTRTFRPPLNHPPPPRHVDPGEDGPHGPRQVRHQPLGPGRRRGCPHASGS